MIVRFVRSRRPRPIDSSNLLGLLAGFVEHVFGELAGQVELVDDRHRVDARLAAGAEHFDDHAFAVADVRREADHFDDDFVVGLHALCAGVADVDRLARRVLPSICTMPMPACSKYTPTKRLVARSTTSMMRPSLLAHAAALGFEAHRDDVAAGGVAGFVGGDEDIGIAAFGAERAFGADEAEAAGGAAEGAGEVFGVAGRFGF